MIILPQPDTLTAPYWSGAGRHQLMLQTCRDCDTAIHPPLPLCPACHGSRLSWTPAQGKGNIYSFTVVHHAAHPAFAVRTPYLVALVTLAEGPRVVCNILDCPLNDVSIGMPVTLTFQHLAPDMALPQFRLDAN